MKRYLLVLLLAASAAQAQQIVIPGGGGQPQAPVDPAKLDRALVDEMQEIFKMDQAVRGRIRSLGLPPGIPLPEVFIEQWNENDRICEERLRAVVKRYGWPTRSKAGDSGATTAFLVVQHASLETQREFLPVIEKAIADGELRKDTIALLTDRIALGEGRKQTYGTQVGFDEQGNAVAIKLDDPDKVDERRASVGLSPLSEYLASFKPRTPAPSVKVDGSGINQELRSEMLALQQQLRAAAPATYGNGVTKDEKTWPPEVLQKRQALKDKIGARIEEILTKHGYPTPALLAEDGSRSFFTLLSHTGPAVQERALERMTKAAEVPQAQLAWLTDRVRRNADKPQVYGTQVLRNAQGTVEAYKLEDAGKVDERRRAVGLNALSDFLAALNIKT